MKDSRKKFLFFLVFFGLITNPAVLIAGDKPDKSFDCVIQPKAKIKLGSSEDGILKEILVDRGDLVKKGQLLASLDSEREELNAELSRLQAETDVQVKLALTQLDFRRKEHERASSLSQKNAMSQTDIDKANVEERLAALNVQSSKTQRETLQVEYKLAKEQLDRRFIKSPADAIVVDVEMSAGEYIHDQAQLMTLAVIDPLYVEVFVPVTYFGKIKEGMTASVFPEDPVGGKHRALVDVVDNVFDPASRTFGVRLILPNEDHKLPAGLRCSVSFSNEGGATE